MPKNKIIKKVIIPDKSIQEDEDFILYSTEKSIKPKTKCRNKDDRYRNPLLLSISRRKNSKCKKSQTRELDVERSF